MKTTARTSKKKTAKSKSILELGGVAKGRKVGAGSEREYAKKVVARKIASEHE